MSQKSSQFSWKKIMTKILVSLLIMHFALEANAHYKDSGNLLEIENESTTKYVIFDTDMGADDAWALQMVLKAEKQSQNVKLLAITVVDGNTVVENVIKNTYRILDGLNRTDVPIYKGATEAIIPIDLKNDQYYGKNGFGDLDIWKPHYPKDINSIIQGKNAIEIIRDSVLKYPNQISILCVGPPTNIALAIKSFPEIKKSIKEVFIMGGSITGRGNVAPAVEFNFYRDPESVYIVLNELKNAVTIIPIDVDESIRISMDWRFNILAKVNHPNVQLLNEIERKCLRIGFRPYDAFTSAALLFPETMIIEMKQHNATIELMGQQTRGQMFVDHHSTDYNVNIVKKMSEDEFKKIILWTANY